MNQASSGDAPKPRQSLLARILAAREFGSLAALLIMVLIIAVSIPQFRQIENLINVTRNFSFVGIMAMGMTLVILTGGIDLSVGSVWAMTAVLAASLMSSGWLLVPAIAVALLAAAAVGLFNGLCVTRLHRGFRFSVSLRRRRRKRGSNCPGHPDPLSGSGWNFPLGRMASVWSA